MSLDKRLIIEDISFGGRTAEEESGNLARYFVETEQWRKVWDDEVDVVFAPKGGGKSAIYSMLVSRREHMFDRSILLVPGENPTGATAFEPIQSSPPTSEIEFVRIWRLYFLVLIVDELERYDVDTPALTRIRDLLSSVGLTRGIVQKRTLIARVREAIKRFFSPESVEGGITLDAGSGAVNGITARITFAEPTAEDASRGVLSVDRLYESIDEILDEQQFTVWLMLDRLDVAFTASPELEANALRALFRVYKLVEPLERLRLKIFLRSDIWSEITAGGFRETSHITRDLNLRWNGASLLQLIIQRLMQSSRLRGELGISAEEALASSGVQQEVFDKVFPRQVDAGSRKPATFDWCLSRTEDGKKVTAPRELIHLFTLARDHQLGRLDTGEASIPEDLYFEPQTFREAHPEVSETRLQRTIYPEYPWAKDWLESLRGQRTHHDTLSLSKVWAVPQSEAEERIKRLVDIGFFEPQGPANDRTYWVPFLYRPALEMVQGTAEGVKDRSGVDDSEES